MIEALRYLPTRAELAVAWQDVIAWWRGYCNDCPARGDYTGGGYAFWRCALKRGHAARHRSINYTWNDAGVTEFDPIEQGRTVAPKQQRPTQTAPSWRLRLARDAWHRRQAVERGWT